MWHYLGMIVDEIPKPAYGFVYLITNIKSGKMYVGRKYFHSKLTKPPLKGKKRKRKIIKESNWRDYYGSSAALLDDIKELGKENFYREMLEIHDTKGETNKAEVDIQFKLDVLNAKDNNDERMYYNNNILGRYFIAPNNHSEESKKKISKSLLSFYENNKMSLKTIEKRRVGQLAWWNSISKEERIEFGSKVSDGLIGHVVSDSHKIKLSEAQKNLWLDPIYREAQCQALSGKTPWNKGISIEEYRKHYKDGQYTWLNFWKDKTYIRVTDGQKERLISHDAKIPKGWKQGRPDNIRCGQKKCVAYYADGAFKYFNSAKELKLEYKMKQSAFETLLLKESDPKYIEYIKRRRINKNITNIMYV